MVSGLGLSGLRGFCRGWRVRAGLEGIRPNKRKSLPGCGLVFLGSEFCPAMRKA